MAITKPAGTWTYEDLFSLPDDGRRYEIIEGELYEMPAPDWDHAITIMNLILLLAPVDPGTGRAGRSLPRSTSSSRAPIPCNRISSCCFPDSPAIWRGSGRRRRARSPDRNP